MNETARQARQRRKREAQERQAAYDALSLDGKLARAIKRGHPNTREAVRLIRAVQDELQRREAQA